MPCQRLPEKPYTLDVGLRLARILAGTRDIQVILTRTRDDYVPLFWRTAIANREVGRRAVFVSIHFNAALRRSAYGIETYYNNARGYRLAALIHPRVVQALGSIDRGIRHRGYFVLRRNRLPAVLVECGFLTNPEEAARITNYLYRERIARAIAAGIMRYY
jgi:N-acetylmuramoyl-L-alanine amidase